MYSKIVGGNKLPYNYAEFICDSENDINNLPTKTSEFACSIGSKALVLETKNVYILNNDNEWVLYGNIESSGGGGINPSGLSIATISQISQFIGL